MHTKPFEYVGVRGVIRGRLSPLTNGSEMLVSRMTRVLTENIAGLSEITLAEIHAIPDMNHVAKAVWSFTNLSRVVEIEGLSYPTPGLFATKDEILAAWDCFMQDDPGFYRYLAEQVVGMDEPETPLEARPQSTLTKEQREDPNLSAAETSTAISAMPKSSTTFGGENRPEKDESSTTTIGTPS